MDRNYLKKGIKWFLKKGEEIMSKPKQHSFWDSVPLQAKQYYEEAMIHLIDLEEISLEDLNEEQQTEAVCLAAVKKRGWELKYVINQTPEICIEAILDEPSVVQIAKYIPEELWYKLIEEDVVYFREFPAPLARDEVYKKTLELNPEVIEIIKNPSEELQLIAVEKQPETIRLIESPSETVQKVAVTQWAGAIGFIENPTDEVKKMVILKNPASIRYIHEQTQELQQLAVKEDPTVLSHLSDPSIRVILEALKGVLDSMDWADNHIPYIVHEHISEELLMTWAMNNTLKEPFPVSRYTPKIADEFSFIAKGYEGWENLLSSSFKNKLIQERYAEMLTFRKQCHFDSKSGGFFSEEDDEMIFHSTEVLIEESPEALSLLPNHERNYRRCRLAVVNDKKTQWHSPYHYWDLKEAGQIK